MTQAQPAAPPVQLPTQGQSAPPRANGELVFEAPWEGRLFGMTMVLVESQVLQWPEFQRELVARIGLWEDTHDFESEEYSYYSCWLEALEVVLDRRALVESSQLGRKLDELAARPHGHDHDH